MNGGDDTREETSPAVLDVHAAHEESPCRTHAYLDAAVPSRRRTAHRPSFEVSKPFHDSRAPSLVRARRAQAWTTIRRVIPVPGSKLRPTVEIEDATKRRAG